VRIISLGPSLTEILGTLGALDQLAGATDACEMAGNHVARLGPPKAIQISRLSQLSPDWVLADARENRPEEIEQIQKQWKTKVLDVRSLQAVLDTIAELGRLTGKTEAARGLNDRLRSEMAFCEIPLSDRPKKRTVLLIWNQPYLTVNFDTYPSRLIDATGGLNAFREEPLAEFPVEMEDIVEKNPEILLLAGAPAPFQKRHVAQFRRYRILSRIPIHLVSGDLFTRYGSRTLEGLRVLREIFSSVS
jgi:ABC-type Fe3+-hydroxamate transport system substrate-binding protein